MSVIVSRALPDVRDGLKPVHRRILYAMSEAGYDWNKAYRKSARVVGDVIGKYHPHGDPPAAMRYTEVRLAKVAHSLLDDLDKDTVDFRENYDGSEKEPVVLPARFP